VLCVEPGAVEHSGQDVALCVPVAQFVGTVVGVGHLTTRLDRGRALRKSLSCWISRDTVGRRQLGRLALTPADGAALTRHGQDCA